MTAKEYLEQPNKLWLKIKSDLKKLDSYKDLASSISSPQFGERVQGTRSVEPPFVRYLGKIDELEREITENKKRIRDSYAAAHPLCEECLKHGVCTPTEEIHHKLPLSQGGTHDRDNLMALCKSCHAGIHAKSGDRWHNR